MFEQGKDIQAYISWVERLIIFFSGWLIVMLGG